MSLRVALVLNGHKDDRGFVQEGYEGALAARDALGLDLDVVAHTQKDPALLQQQIEEAIARGARGVIVHGSRADAPVEFLATRYPECRFLSPGGQASGANVWNYAVRHHEGAFLAGVLAARLTKSGTVGHLSGVAIAPGKKGRAAFVAGVRHADPAIGVITGFCGDQDNPALADAWISAEAEAGADVIFTMLNSGRSGAIAACRRHGIQQIGNIRDWTKDEPEIFPGSVLSRHGWSVGAWLRDLADGSLVSGQNRHPGLDEPEAVRLCLGPTVADSIRDEIESVAEMIKSGGLTVPVTYDGPEFEPAKPVLQA